MPEPQDFDAVAAVATYRDVIELFEQQTTVLGKAEFRSIAQRLRRQWKEWQGEDSLHEMAFGKRDE